MTSDHGESFGEHGDQTHSYLVYETTQRVPLIFAGPGIPGGRTVAAPVGLVDVAPTVLALARAQPLPETAGRDLRPLFAGEQDAPENAYFETVAPQLDFGWSPLLGLRAGSLKYIRAPRPELYDLAADPAEQHSLAGERPELVASLDAALEARLRASPARAATPLAVSPSEREALARLGYLPSQAAGAELGVVGGRDPKDQLEVIAEVGRAQVAMAEGRADEALARLRTLGDAGPSVAGLRAAAAVNAGEPAAAEQDARAALKASPRRDDYVSVLALALDAQGRGDEAVAELRKLPADLPLSAEVALRLAAAQVPDEGSEIALQRIERALELAPGDPQLARARELLTRRACASAGAARAAGRRRRSSRAPALPARQGAVRDRPSGGGAAGARSGARFARGTPPPSGAPRPRACANSSTSPSCPRGRPGKTFPRFAENRFLCALASSATASLSIRKYS